MKMVKIFGKLLMAWVTMCSHAGLAQKSQDIMNHEKVIKQYYSAYEKKDWAMLEQVLDDGFIFTSPAGDDHINLKLYKERCWPNAYNTKKFKLERIIVDGDDAFVTYNGWTTDGKLFRNTERFKFKQGKIKENECFFGPGVSFPNNAKK
jgi:ketosteroid isomerase-like protein